MNPENLAMEGHFHLFLFIDMLGMYTFQEIEETKGIVPTKLLPIYSYFTTCCVSQAETLDRPINTCIVPYPSSSTLQKSKSSNNHDH